MKTHINDLKPKSSVIEKTLNPDTFNNFYYITLI